MNQSGIFSLWCSIEFGFLLSVLPVHAPLGMLLTHLVLCTDCLATSFHSPLDVTLWPTALSLLSWV